MAMALFIPHPHPRAKPAGDKTFNSSDGYFHGKGEVFFKIIEGLDCCSTKKPSPPFFGNETLSSAASG